VEKDSYRLARVTRLAIGKTLDVSGWGTGDEGLHVWGVEPFFGGSHKVFLEGLAGTSAHRFSLLTLPGRHWKWRMQGGAISLAGRARRASQDAAGPDVIFASDMLDLPLFLTLTRHETIGAPSIVYFHENQLTYPLPPGVERDLGYGFKNLCSAVAADAVFFNTAYHLDEFLGAASALLEMMPDEVPGGLIDEIAGKAKVLPLGCDLSRLDEHHDVACRESEAGRWGSVADGPLVVWNQRWEYDKAPEVLLEALLTAKRTGHCFRLALAGDDHLPPAPRFADVRAALGDSVVHWGYLQDFSDYASLLWSADVVVSTAIHEFFGVAIVEAIYCGCRPVLPRKLSYPEIIPAEVHGEVLYGEGELPAALTRAFAYPRAWSEDWQRTWVSRFDWRNVRNRYDEEIRRCWENAQRRTKW